MKITKIYLDGEPLGRSSYQVGEDDVKGIHLTDRGAMIAKSEKRIDIMKSEIKAVVRE